MNRVKAAVRDYRLLLLLLAAGLLVACWFIGPIISLYSHFSDREWINTYIASWGAAAPIVFILLQVLQVVIAPIPGELSGFIGGYLFGAAPGLVYSTIGLTLGSAINFGIGRLLGQGVVRRLIPPAHLEKLDSFLHKQGIFVVLIFFIFPGFPKDYLSLFLGVTAMPFKLFLFIAAFGRIPGTIMLSVQGAFLYQKMYGVLAMVLGASVVFVLIAFLFRERIYGMAKRFDSK
ncbi:MAG: TVP38/TMEM64 family protein [Deltaproteobacteria bacterium]|nr:TVP38/TMEM64 family protein [Deltaproteobacteria bacterium]